MNGSVGPPNFDDLDKFLVSLGLAALVGAGAIPWVLQRGSEDLLLSQEDIAKLAPTAQKVIAQRQDWLSFSSVAGPWISIILVFVGMLVIRRGLMGWQERQIVADTRAKVALKREETELERLTPEQVEQKLEAEVDEVIETSSTEMNPQVERVEVLDRFRRIDQAVIGAVAVATPTTHRLLAGVRLGGPPGLSFELDALVRSEDRVHNDVAVEVKFVMSGRGIQRSLDDFAIRIARCKAPRLSVLMVFVRKNDGLSVELDWVAEHSSESLKKLGIRARVDVVNEVDLPKYRPLLQDLI